MGHSLISWAHGIFEFLNMFTAIWLVLQGFQVFPDITIQKFEIIRNVNLSPETSKSNLPKN